jgi:hypothetical protein
MAAGDRGGGRGNCRRVGRLACLGQRGYVGHNPRAINEQAMRNAIQEEARTYIGTWPIGIGNCLSLPFDDPQAKGIPGIAANTVPGQHSVTYLLRATEQNQARRDGQIVQMNYLAAQGFFAAQKVMLATTAGPMEAMEYRITWDGYTELGGYTCARPGRREIASIDDIRPAAQAQVAGFPVYDVTVRFKVADMPPWNCAQFIDPAR